MCILCKFTSHQSWNFGKMEENWQKIGKIWVSLRVLVLMKYEIWVRAAPVQCGYGTRTRTVRVFVKTILYPIFIAQTYSCFRKMQTATSLFDTLNTIESIFTHFLKRFYKQNFCCTIMRKMNASIIARFVQQFHLSIMILMTMKIPFIAVGNGFSDDISNRA